MRDKGAHVLPLQGGGGQGICPLPLDVLSHRLHDFAQRLEIDRNLRLAQLVEYMVEAHLGDKFFGELLDAGDQRFLLGWCAEAVFALGRALGPFTHFVFCHHLTSVLVPLHPSWSDPNLLANRLALL